MTIRRPHLALVLCVLLPGNAVAQMSPSEQRGIGKVSASPLKIAPLFRELHLRYPVESLQRSLVEGIRTGHVNMPEFRLDPGQASDVIAYLKSLER